MGASRLQPGDRAAGGADRQPRRGLRAVGAAGVHGGRRCRAGPAAGRARLVYPAAAALLVAAARLWGNARLGRRTLLQAGTPMRIAVIQGNIAQDDKWNPALRDVITDRYLAMTRRALGAGARFILWPESSTPFYFEQDLIRGGGIRRLAAEAQRDAADRQRPGRADQDRRPRQKPDGALLQRRLSGAAERTGRRRLSEDAPGAVWRVRAAQATCCSSSARSSKRSRPSRPGSDPVLLPVDGHMVSTAICYEVIFPRPDPPIRERRQRTAHDHHQRRVVRPFVGRLSALGTVVHACDRAGALPGACRQHRHQRLRRSVRSRGGEDRICFTRRS